MLLPSDCYFASNGRCETFNRGNCVDTKACSLLKREAEYYKSSLLSVKDIRALPKLSDMTSEKNQVIFDEIRTYCKDIREFIDSGESLYLCDPYGNSAKHWGLKFIQRFFEDDWGVSIYPCHSLYINVSSDYIIESRNSIDKRSDKLIYIRDNIATADLVILDDFGEIDLKSSSERANLLWLVRQRKDKSTIFISSLGIGTLSDFVGKSTAEEVKVLVGTNVFNFEKEDY